MANYIPFILAGAAIAYVTVGGKKKKQPAAIWISDDCTEARVMGLNSEQMMEKAGDEKFAKKFQAAMKKWSIDTLDLANWFHERPNLNPEDLDDFAMEIAAWRYPQCEISENMAFDSMPFKVVLLVFAAVTSYALENGIITSEQFLGLMEAKAVEHLGPLMPEGATAARQMPIELQMMLV